MTKEILSVFKIGGSVIDDHESLDRFLRDFSGIQGKKILVHGGGKWVSDICRRLNIEVKMIHGRRITDKPTLDVVTMILPGLANKNVVALLQKYGCNALGLTGADGDMILAGKRPVKEGVDFGYVGDIARVHTGNLIALLTSGFIPVFTAMTHDGKGQLLNTNADTIAASLAVNLARSYNVTLFYCFDKNGVLENESDENSFIKRINRSNYMKLKASGVIHSGMLPKIDNAFDAITNGVERVYICHHRNAGLLGNELSAKGTLITD